MLLLLEVVGPIPPLRKLGGKAMSLGSDAHTAEGVGSGFDKALSMLTAAGIDQVAVFKNRVREDVLFPREKSADGQA